MGEAWAAPRLVIGRVLRPLNRRAPRTLRGRLALTFAGVVVLVMLILGAYLATAARDLYLDRLSDQLLGEARLAAEALAPPLQDDADPDAMRAAAQRIATLAGARVTITAADGSVIADSAGVAAATGAGRARLPATTASIDDEAPATGRRATIHEDALTIGAFLPDSTGSAVWLAVPLDDVDAAVRRIQRDLAVATFAAALLVVAVGFVVASRIAQPLEELRHQAQAVAAGRLDVEVLPSATRELGDLGRAFNSMTRQLAASRAERDRARARLEAMLANLSDGVIVTDQRGGLIRLNRAAATLLAFPNPTPANQPFLQIARDHELWELLRTALVAPAGDNTARTATIEHGLSRRTLDATAKRLDGAGERLGLLVLRDVTELRRLERVRREFVANVSHELRTPLASIKALVETLEAGAIDDQDVAGHFLHQIVGEVDRLAALVDDLLDLARLESGRVTLHAEPLAPGDLLRRGLDRLRPQTERARLTLDLVTADDLPLVFVDRAQIEQVLLNLVHNAIKFTPPGGTITVSATADPHALRVSVRDTGVGVADDELPRLFERFYKADKARRSDGTGLGLAIAKHIVQAHGGTIGAESHPGRGATFSFTLPYEEPRVHREPTSSLAGSAHYPGASVPLPMATAAGVARRSG